jgi:hypothetical protein
MSQQRSTALLVVCAGSVLAFGSRPTAAQTVVGWLAPVSGSWTNGANWSGGTAPNNGIPGGATYNAFIDAVGANYTVTLNTPTTVVSSLTINSANAFLSLGGSSVFRAINGVSVGPGIFAVGTGLPNTVEIANTAFSGSGTLFMGSAVLLTGVTLNVNSQINATGSVRVVNGLTMGAGNLMSMVTNSAPDGTILFGNTPQTVTGGTIEFNGTGDDNAARVFSASPGLTIGVGTTIRSGTVGGLIGNAGAPLLNQGTIISRTVGRTVRVAGNNWVNQGLLQSQNNNARLYLEGTIAVGGLGEISSLSGGQVALLGTLNNAGNTLLLDEPDDRLVLQDSACKIVGGTVRTSNGGTLLSSGTGMQLDNVTLDTNLNIATTSVFERRYRALGTLTLNAGRTITIAGDPLDGGQASLDFIGASQLLTGNGEIVFSNNSTPPVAQDTDYNAVGRLGGGPFVVDSGITIRTGTDGGWVGNANSPATFKGLIRADVPNRPIALLGNPLRNQGVIEINGGAIELQGTVAPGGLGTVIGTNPTPITVSGVFDNTGAEIELGGQAAARLNMEGQFIGGTIIIDDNDPAASRGGVREIGVSTSGVVHTDKQQPDYTQLAQIGTAQSGRPAYSEIAVRRAERDEAIQKQRGEPTYGLTQLEPVMIDDIAGISFTKGAAATFRQGVTLGDVTVASANIEFLPYNLVFTGTQTLQAVEGRITGGGTTGVPRATILFDAPNAMMQGIDVRTGTLTISDGMAIVTGRSPALFRIVSGASVVNNGLLSSRTPGLEIAFEANTTGGTSFTNAPTGILEAGPSATLRIRNGIPLTNQGLIKSLGTVTFDTTAGVLTNAAGGTIAAISGGASTLRGGTGLAPNAGTLLCGAGSRIDIQDGGFAIAPSGVLDFDVAGLTLQTYGRITATGPVTVGGTLRIGLSGGFQPAWGNAVDVLTSTGAVSGSFTSFQFPALANPDRTWWHEVLPNGVRVGVRHVADFNHDGAVNTIDLTTFLGQFGQSGTGLVADIDGNGTVNTQDLTRFLGAFGTSIGG